MTVRQAHTPTIKPLTEQEAKRNSPICQPLHEAYFMKFILVLGLL